MTVGSAGSTAEDGEPSTHVLDQGNESLADGIGPAAGDVAVDDVDTGQGGKAHGCGVDEGAGVIDEVRARDGRAKDDGCFFCKGQPPPLGEGGEAG